jgi:hypothetical protein
MHNVCMYSMRVLYVCMVFVRYVTHTHTHTRTHSVSRPITSHVPIGHITTWPPL